MRSAVWVALLRHLPPEQHDQIMLVTAAGTEIAIGGILRLEQEFVVIKGRLSGSQDSGRVFIIPFNQIDYLGFQKPLKDTEFHEMFASFVVPAGGAPELVEVFSAPFEALESAPPPAAEAPPVNGDAAAAGC